jgi:hypothetical protein
MSKLGNYRVWDGELLHTVSGIDWVMGGVKWYGPGVGDGWLFINPEFDWKGKEVPDTDLLLEVVESNYED